MVYLLPAALKDSDVVILIETVKQGIYLERLLGFHGLLGKLSKSLYQILLHVKALRFDNTLLYGIFTGVQNGIELVNSLPRHV